MQYAHVVTSLIFQNLYENNGPQFLKARLENVMHLVVSSLYTVCSLYAMHLHDITIHLVCINLMHANETTST